MKHTPAPWWTTHQSDNRRAVRDSGGLICTLKRVFRYPDQEERYEKELEEYKANAYLIAAAPEMERMLLMAMSIIIKHGHVEMVEEYNALIKKLSE